MKCDRFFVILDRFLPFYSSNNPKIQNFEKMKQKCGDIIILHMHNINGNHMMYGFWDMKRDRQKFPLKTQNIKIKKLKKPWRYYHFTHVHHKLQSYDVWFLKYWAWQIDSFAILDNFLPIYFLKTRKSKFWKNEKKHLEISSFYKIVPKIRIMCYTVPEIWHITDVIIVIFHFGLFFALSPPLTAQEMKIFFKK